MVTEIVSKYLNDIFVQVWMQKIGHFICSGLSSKFELFANRQQLNYLPGTSTSDLELVHLTLHLTAQYLGNPTEGGIMSSKTTFVSFIITLLAFCQLYAQETWVYYNSDNSVLPNGYFESIVFDSSGAVWMGTPYGLAFFDGTNWAMYDTTNSGLLDNSIGSVAIDGNGDKWIGTTAGGLAFFDGTNWVVYDTTNSGLPDNRVESLAIDDSGNKWIGTTTGGLTLFDGFSWEVYNTSNSGLPGDRVGSIAIDASGNGWIGPKMAGLAFFEGTTWTVYDSPNSDMANNYLWSIVIDESGSKWIGTGGSGLVFFDGIDWTVYNPSNSGLPHWWVRSIAIDRNGNKWIGTHSEFFAGNSGALIFFDGTNWEVFDTENSGLPYNDITAISIDRNGNKWIGTSGGGVAVYNEGGVTLGIDGGANDLEAVANFRLHQNYPNPFNPTTTISYDLPELSKINLTIYDVTGREITILHNQEQPAGHYDVQWNGVDESGHSVSTGVYFARLKAGDYSKTIKMVYLK